MNRRTPPAAGRHVIGLRAPPVPAAVAARRRAMSGVLPVWTAALGAAPWLMSAARDEAGSHPPHDMLLQGAPWDDTLAWELHEWAFDSTTMVRSSAWRASGAPWRRATPQHSAQGALLASSQVGARLAQPAAADEALLPLRVAPAVHLPLRCDADEAAPVAAAPGEAQAVYKAKAGRRVYTARPAVCQVAGCGQGLSADVHAYCFRCARPAAAAFAPPKSVADADARSSPPPPPQTASARCTCAPRRCTSRAAAAAASARRAPQRLWNCRNPLH